MHATRAGTSPRNSIWNASCSQALNEPAPAIRSEVNQSHIRSAISQTTTNNKDHRNPLFTQIHMANAGTASQLKSRIRCVLRREAILTDASPNWGQTRPTVSSQSNQKKEPEGCGVSLRFGFGVPPSRGVRRTSPLSTSSTARFRGSST